MSELISFSRDFIWLLIGELLSYDIRRIILIHYIQFNGPIFGLRIDINKESKEADQSILISFIKHNHNK